MTTGDLSSQCRHICGRPPDISPFKLIDIPVTFMLGNVYIIFWFLRFSVFKLGARTKRTNRRTDEQDS